MSERLPYTKTGFITLHLTRELSEEYEKEELLLRLKYYKIVRDKYGIWAGNQDKFVASIADFNPWDDMQEENLYEKYKDQL
jgi:hypothetical protein